MNEMIAKSEDCIMCVCRECYEKYDTDTMKCEHSDCRWCQDELGNHTEFCRVFDYMVGD